MLSPLIAAAEATTLEINTAVTGPRTLSDPITTRRISDAIKTVQIVTLKTPPNVRERASECNFFFFWALQNHARVLY